MRRQFEASVRVQATPAAAIRFVQQLPALARLNPLVVSVEPTPSGAWRVTDRLFGGWEVAYTAAVEATPDGARTVSDAPLGVTTWSVWRVEPVEGGCVITESGELEAPWWAIWYVHRTATAAHQRLIAAVKRALEEGER